MRFKIYVLIIFSLEVRLSKNLNKPRPLKNTAGHVTLKQKNYQAEGVNISEKLLMHFPIKYTFRLLSYNTKLQKLFFIWNTKKFFDRI